MPVRRVDLNDYTLDLRRAAEEAGAALREGKLAVVPTETVYGVAAKLDAPGAVDALRQLRGGESDKPLGPFTPHLSDPAEAAAFTGEVGDVGRKLMRKLWPGPVALVFDVPADRRQEAAAAMNVEPSLIYSAEGRVTLRCPDEPTTRLALAVAGQPSVLTRAGLPAGAAATKPPSDADLDGLPIEFVHDAGPTRYARPSTVVRVVGEEWTVVRDGVYDRRIVERLLRTTVLFVCSGNTCRSPMAMALGRRILAEELKVKPADLDSAGYDVVSAGSYAMPDMRATPAAAEAVAGMGGDLASHRSRPLDVATVNRSDLIVTMGEEHRRAVLSLVPSAAGKTVNLDPKGDIDDPIGNDAGHYRDLAGRIEGLVRERLRERLLASA